MAQTIRQTTVVPSASYSYQPVNYVLLAGILEKIYPTDYNSLFDKEIKDAMKLKETSFYSETNMAQALSYSQSTAGPVYAPTTASSYADELGTGNVFMSAKDLYSYFQALFNEQFLTSQDRNELWHTYPGEKYASGLYTMTNSYHTRGVKARFEAVADFQKTGRMELSYFRMSGINRRGIIISLLNYIKKSSLSLSDDSFINNYLGVLLNRVFLL